MWASRRPHVGFLVAYFLPGPASSAIENGSDRFGSVLSSQHAIVPALPLGVVRLPRLTSSSRKCFSPFCSNARMSLPLPLCLTLSSCSVDQTSSLSHFATSLL